MVTDFKLESEKKGSCMIMSTYGHINNVGGQKIDSDHFQKRYFPKPDFYFFCKTDLYLLLEVSL